MSELVLLPINRTVSHRIFAVRYEKRLPIKSDNLFASSYVKPHQFRQSIYD